MKILVTGAKGFVGKNLCAQLNNIKDGKARNYPVNIEEVFEYDIDSSPADLERYCSKADFVFNLAGINRPENPEDFKKGNFDFASVLLDTLKKYGNTVTVMLSSSIQATLAGRYAGHPYGISKKAGEELFFRYADETGARVLVYRFPNIFGKWCRPNYNSAVATFCNNIANDLPITINDPDVELELLYIDDLVEEMILALQGKEHRCDFDGTETILNKNGRYCAAVATHRIRLGEIVSLLEGFKAMPGNLNVPDLSPGCFEKKLYSTYLSYLPPEKMKYPLKMNVDNRGSFTEIIRTGNAGQFSVNISRPGITKGEHWHHTKNEKFIVVKGHGLIQQRREDSGDIFNFEVSGDRIEVVEAIPGYTHNIINLSETEDLITLIWCNEPFDPNHPDTFFDPVKK
ncbi:MAG: NAD-dependent epimerase/dehydratase family protein [Muribaculaceae bacterium]|nr:NAD-dependent epimerase/dehydratase family protein [Muribaculaceae bacterium]